jgi:hypothetical protein
MFSIDTPNIKLKKDVSEKWYTALKVLVFCGPLITTT